MITVAVCGCGSRGVNSYAKYALVHPDKMKVVAGADIDQEKLNLFKSIYNVQDDMLFHSDDELLSKPKLADVLVIATQDRHHVKEAIKALELGYHLVIEKPISPDLEECLKLSKKVYESKSYVVVCHVLRHSPFYKKVRKLLRAKVIGDIRTISMAENVSYWHYTHSFVRGNWRDSNVTSSVIMQKCIHDLDIMRWLAESKCNKIQSFGELSYFNSKNKPEGASDRCFDCKYKETCPYSAYSIYITGKYCGVRHNNNHWLIDSIVNNPTEENLIKALDKGPYGKCVFACDNNVCDHQVVNAEFDNHIIGSFVMSAFTEKYYRTLKVTGTKGELYGSIEDNKIHIERYGQEEEIVDVGDPGNIFAGHGGVEALMSCMCRLIENNEEYAHEKFDVVLDSHLMAIAAEESRINNGKVIDLNEYKK